MFGTETEIERMFKNAELNRLKVEETNYRYVWLNLITGEFLNSWEGKDQTLLVEKDFQDVKYKGWKLIKYQCLNDNEFEFYNMMKLK